MKINLKNFGKRMPPVIALGGESEGNFCALIKQEADLSQNYGDLLDDGNFSAYHKDLLKKIAEVRPGRLIIDLNPLYRTSILGESLSKKLNIKLIGAQHHHAHIFSAAVENGITGGFTGIACDGTGWGTDETVWGGEVFSVSAQKVERVGSLESHQLIGGDLAVKEPARMLAAILFKTLNSKEKSEQWLKKYFSKKELELLHSQYCQNFNCLYASSTGRVLDAVSLLLGFCKNERPYKHQPIKSLEENSSLPYQLAPKILFSRPAKRHILAVAPLFSYLIKNFSRDKKRLAATAQKYLAEGLFLIADQHSKPIVFGGGMANNRIMSGYLKSQGVKVNKQIPSGDAGLSFGQTTFFALTAKNL